MADLALYLENQGLLVEPIEIDSFGLLKALSDRRDSCAILWLDEHHWVCAVAKDGSHFLYYDYPSWHTSEASELALRFSGRALFLSADKSGPGLRASIDLRRLLLALLLINLVAAAGIGLRNLRCRHPSKFPF